MTRFTKSGAAEVDLIDAARGREPLLVSLRDPEDFRPLTHEQWRTLASQIVILALVEHRPAQIQARAFKNASHFFPNQRSVDMRRAVFEPCGERLLRYDIRPRE